MRHSRIGKLLGVAVGVVALVGLSALVTGGFARSKDDSTAIVAQAKQRGFVFACPQRKGHNQSKGDLNVRLRAFCAKGQKPLKIALFPVKGKRGPRGPQGPPGPPGPAGGGGGSSAEYGVANVFVSRGGAAPSRFGTFSVALGSPVGSTTSGSFRFTCTPAQSPCKISFGAAVLSSESGRASVYPRLLIHRESGSAANSPITFCEYADGPVNGIPREPLRSSLNDIRGQLTMNVGGSFDCGPTGQPGPPGRVDEIWVTSASSVDAAYYDVWTTFTFLG